MTQLQPSFSSALRAAADKFIETTREDFERSFSLMDFIRRAEMRGFDKDMDQQGFILKHFNDHYDLVRWPTRGPHWSLVPGCSEPSDADLEVRQRSGQCRR
jgi:hypothetical protein